jgi:glucosamine 6-phosphate synthetase-like amidotransferase/phosphosugar isomerase protein
MCGIFGFILKKPVSMTKVFQILRKLEASKYHDETQPLGGYGAGIAAMLSGGEILSEKVGKTTDSPARQLEALMAKKPMDSKLTQAAVLLGHVRFPSFENMGTVKFKEATQPYVEHFEPKLTIVSAHNGSVENFKELKAKLKTHVFESDKVGFIDSEVIPHYFGEMLNEQESTDTAVYKLFSELKGSGVAALLQVDEDNAFLHLIYKGQARGLTVWNNDKNEVIFCSRPEPIEEEFKELLAIGKFEKKVTINWKENAGLKLSFPATFE